MNIFNILLIQPLASGLVLFYKLLGQNMGVAIIAFSLFLRFALKPLTKPYMDSMGKMKEFQPQLDKLKKKYKNDKVKMAQAQADFFKEKGISPGSGCLPYILQIVVLIAFFNVFTRTLANGGNMIENFNALVYEPLKFAQDAVLNTRFLYLDVTKPDIINIPSLSFGIPGPILFLAALAQLVSAKVMAPRAKIEEKVAEKTKDTSDDIQVVMQQSMTYTFPLFTLLIGMRFASGLALYWLVFSLTQVYQQVRSQGWGGMEPWLKKVGLSKLIS